MSTQQKKEKQFSGVGSAADSVKEAADKADSTVRNVASDMAHKASDAGSYLAHKAEDTASAVACGMKSLGGTIRDNGPHDGMFGNISSAVAGTLESSGRELQEHGLTGIADDVTNTVRRHPVPAMLIGVGLGFMLARMFSK